MTQDAHRRRFPRLELQVPCSVAIRPSAIGPGRETIRSVTTSLSCEGAGLITLAGETPYFRRGQPIGLDLLVEGHLLSIRSQVAWHRSDISGQMQVGLRLLLALCPRVVRCAYGEWIIASMRHFDSGLEQHA